MRSEANMSRNVKVLRPTSFVYCRAIVPIVAATIETIVRHSSLNLNLCNALVLLVGLFLGCTPVGTDVSKRSSNEPLEDGVSEAAQPKITVVDRLGHAVNFQRAPRRVVSLVPSATELLFAIGAGSTVVGATKHCNYPAEAMQVPRVGSGLVESTSREAILALKPDLVLCKWDTHEPLMRLFEQVGIPALNLGAETLDELFTEATLLGRATGQEQAADSLIKEMTDRRDQLVERVADFTADQQRSVFYEVWDDPLMTAGPKSFIGELLKMGRMKNIFEDTDVPYPRISSEVVVARNPDVILTPTSHMKQVDLATLASRPGWANIRAITHKQLYTINGDEVSRCGPRLLNALEQMIDAVYPETKLKETHQP